jgi:hypothetical protein
MSGLDQGPQSRQLRCAARAQRKLEQVNTICSARYRDTITANFPGETEFFLERPGVRRQLARLPPGRYVGTPAATSTFLESY